MYQPAPTRELLALTAVMLCFAIPLAQARVLNFLALASYSAGRIAAMHFSRVQVAAGQCSVDFSFPPRVRLLQLI